MYLTDSIIRARYRNGFEKGELMKPSEKYQLTIALPPVSNVFVKGHKIRLEISSSNYPTFDPKPNTGDPYTRGGKTTVAENTIYHDAENPSHVLLPTIPYETKTGDD
jgi:putative CocE/NonD family hydrolase